MEYVVINVWLIYIWKELLRKTFCCYVGKKYSDSFTATYCNLLIQTELKV